MTKVKLADGTTSKLGNMFRTYSDSDTCPSTCPLKDAGCYAKTGPTSWVWKKVDAGNNVTDWNGLCSSVKRLSQGEIWRHNVAGDLPHSDGSIDNTALDALTRANRGKRGFTYTHHLPTEENVQAVSKANQDGFTINLSANGLHQVDAYADTGLPVVTILPIDAPKVQRTAQGRKVVVCPAVSNPDKVTCKSCGICANPNRGYVIGFPAHGARKKSAQEIANG